jgi:hypothetical protein
VAGPLPELEVIAEEKSRRGEDVQSIIELLNQVHINENINKAIT